MTDATALLAVRQWWMRHDTEVTRAKQASVAMRDAMLTDRKAGTEATFTLVRQHGETFRQVAVNLAADRCPVASAAEHITEAVTLLGYAASTADVAYASLDRDKFASLFVAGTVSLNSALDEIDQLVRS